MDKPSQLSPTRLRIGVLCFALFWIPLPVFVILLGQKNNSGETPHAAFVAAIFVGLIQTAFLIVGVVIAGKETLKIFKDCTWRTLPRNVWHVLRHGSEQHP